MNKELRAYRKRALQGKNAHSTRMQHRKDLMHEARGATQRLNSRVNRGDQEKPVGGKLIHWHCGCGGSGCVGLTHMK